MAGTSPTDALAKSLFLNARECILTSIVSEDRGPATEESLYEQDRYIDSMAHLASALHQRFQLELAERRRRRNSRLAVHRLPKEVLATTFIMTMDPEDHPKHYCRQRGALELVCHNWGTIIYTSPVFWALVSSALPEKVNDQSLRLSKEYPLICVTEVGASLAQRDRFWKHVKPYTHRYGIVDASVSDAILDIINGGLARLRELKLLGTSSTSNTSRDVLISTMGSPWPQLEHLELTRIYLPWSRPLVSNLSWLFLDDVFDLAFEVLLEIVRSSPRLEYLDITARFAEAGSSNLNAKPPDQILMPLLREFHLYHVSSDAVNQLLGLIQPTLLKSLSLCYDELPPADIELSDLPIWSVTSAVDILLSSERIDLSGTLNGCVNCADTSYRLMVTAPVKATMSWLAKVVDRYPESAPPVRIRCMSRFRLELLTQYLGSLLMTKRCELIVETANSEPEVLSSLEYLCQRLTEGTFPLTSLTELSIYIQDEEMADNVADLLQQRYQKPLLVAPLRKLSYTTGFGGYRPDNFEQRMTEILGNCPVEWEPEYEWSGGGGSEHDGSTSSFDAEQSPSLDL